MTSSYTSRAACHGKRPHAFASESGQHRAHLIARLLKERSVARFIVAPSGYGKTRLAFEYAEAIFNWAHTFWFNAQSPCFIRDVDAGSFASSCLAFDPQAALVVIDDIPYLDTARAELFSNEIDTFIDAGCEVIITATPICTLPGSLQHDRLCLEAADLLLSDDELEEYLYQEDRQGEKAQDIPLAHRVPALIWGSRDEKEGAEAFYKHVLSDEVPSDVLNVMALIFVLRTGSFETVAALTPVDKDMLASLRKDYPHLGINEELCTFDAIPIEIETLAPQLKPRFDSIIERSVNSSKTELLDCWTNALMSLNQAPRACEFIHALGNRQEAALWLIDHQREVIRQACFCKALLIARNTTGLSPFLRGQLNLIEALSCQILADSLTAVTRARRIAFSEALSDETRACAFLILAKLGTLEDYQQSREFFETLDIASVATNEERTPDEDWKLLAWMKREGFEDVAMMGKAWQCLWKIGAPYEILCVGASWFFSEYARALQKGHDEISRSELESIQSYVRNKLEEPEGMNDFYVVSAGLSMEDAHECGMAYTSGMINASILFGLRQFEIALLGQRSQLAREQREQELRRAEWAEVHPDRLLSSSTRAEAHVNQRIPNLTLRLFGALEVSIGDTPLEGTGALKNHNARTLLAILAVNQGKEVSRDAIAHAVWPESEHRVANKNFYTVWSRLRQTLSLPDGTCPYLIRHQYGCSLTQRYIKSDIERFNEICRTLLFGMDDHTDWSSLFYEIDRDFASDLLPGEMNNRVIATARREYRDKLVDALVSASVGNLDAGEPKWGICFAREALRRDSTREDAYVALMRSQMAYSQRTSAIMTYLRCQKALSEQLGIDPSPETALLYEDLLAGNEDRMKQGNGSLSKP